MHALSLNTCTGQIEHHAEESLPVLLRMGTLDAELEVMAAQADLLKFSSLEYPDPSGGPALPFNLL